MICTILSIKTLHLCNSDGFHRYQKGRRNMRSQTNHFKLVILYKEKPRKENSRRYDICRTNVHRASNAKHSRSKKHLENIKQEDMIIQDWLFQKPDENLINIPRRIFNTKPLTNSKRE